MLFWFKCCFIEWKCGVTLLNSMHKVKYRAIEILFLHRLGLKCSKSYLLLLLETFNWPMHMLAIQRVYKNIKKVKNMSCNKLPTHALNM